MMTEFGGAVAVPKAVRNSDSTTTIRVNDVIMIRIDGAVNSAINWIARSGDAAATLAAEIDADVLRERRIGQRSGGDYQGSKEKYSTRKYAAGLTKSSLDGPARTPFRPRDFQSR